MHKIREALQLCRVTRAGFKLRLHTAQRHEMARKTKVGMGRQAKEAKRKVSCKQRWQNSSKSPLASSWLIPLLFLPS